MDLSVDFYGGTAMLLWAVAVVAYFVILVFFLRLCSLNSRHVVKRNRGTGTT